MTKLLKTKLWYWYKDKGWALLIVIGLAAFILLAFLTIPLFPNGHINGVVTSQFYLESETKANDPRAGIALENGKSINITLSRRNDVVEGQAVCLAVTTSFLGNKGYKIVSHDLCNS